MNSLHLCQGQEHTKNEGVTTLYFQTVFVLLRVTSRVFKDKLLQNLRKLKMLFGLDNYCS